MQLANIPEAVTRLLKEWSSGEQSALDDILDLAYRHLRGEAQRQLAKYKFRDQIVQPTQLVHEAYIKFREENLPTFVSRRDFEWFASRIIRNVLVDHIRAMNRSKRKAEQVLPLDEERDPLEKETKPDQLDPETFLDIAKAMDRLERAHPRQNQIVTLRFIMGKTIAETAEILGLSPTTVKAEWKAAQVWLFKQLSGRLGGQKL